jgi:hypothetical protein
MLNNKPRVFVSSTIYDFSDLRSAIRFYLEDFGFEVQMSEFNDFERRPEEDTFTSCFNAIAYCHFYILLVGGRKGAEFRDGVSVTQQEFRIAADLARQGKVRPVLFVRQDVRTAVSAIRQMGPYLLGPGIRKIIDWPRRRATPPVRVLQNPEFVAAFINEIENTDYPSGISGGRSGKMWLYRFATFRDIVDALRVNLRLHRSVHAQALLANLEWELMENLAMISVKLTGGGTAPDHAVLMPLRKTQPIRLDDRKPLRIDYERALDLAVFNLSIYWQFPRLRTEALQEAIYSGEFLRYAPESKRLVVTDVQEAMDALLFEIRRCQELCKRRDQRPDEADLARMLEDSDDPEKPKPESVEVSHAYLSNIYSIYDALEEVHTLIIFLLVWMRNPEKAARFNKSQVRPPTPFEDRIAIIQERTATPEDMKPYLDDIISRTVK